MKKLVVAAFVVVLLVIGVSCSGHECEICGSKKGVKKVEAMGAKHYVCADCREAQENQAKSLRDLANSFYSN